MINRVEELWREYRDACYGKVQITRQQEVETRQAFYAGCLATCSEFMMVALNTSEVEAEKAMGRFMKEVEDAMRERIAEMKGRQ